MTFITVETSTVKEIAEFSLVDVLMCVADMLLTEIAGKTKRIKEIKK